METITSTSPSEWLHAVAPLLRAHEAEHGLMLGIASSVAAQRTDVQAQEFWGYILAAGQVVAAALSLHEERLILSRGPREAIELLSGSARGPRRHILLGPPDSVHAAAAASGRPHRAGMRQGIYALTRVNLPRSVSGQVRQATSDDLALLVHWSLAFEAEALGNAPTEEEVARGVQTRLDRAQLYVWEDAGQVVAMTGVAGPTRGPGQQGGGLRVNAVYTPPALRGHGYASALVAHVSQRVLDAGHDFAFLYTDLANPTSNAIYRRVGYEWVAESHEELLEVGAPAAT